MPFIGNANIPKKLNKKYEVKCTCHRTHKFTSHLPTKRPIKPGKVHFHCRCGQCLDGYYADIPTVKYPRDLTVTNVKYDEPPQPCIHCGGFCKDEISVFIIR